MANTFAAKGFLFLRACLLCSFSVAQQALPPAQPALPVQQRPTQQNPQDQAEEEKQIEQKEQSQRAAGILPTFGVTSRQDAPPLTPKGKFHLFVKSAFDPVTFGIVGLQAGLSQAENEFPAYGQGASGYGKRYGASLADNVSSGLLTNYFYPVLFKEDPRYFRLGEGTIRHRFLYGIKQEFVCHTDKGGRSFHWSNVLGAFTSGAISNLYYPGKMLISITPATATAPAIPRYEDDRGVILTFSRSLIALGYGTVGGLFDEFWPDIQRKLSHKHNKDDAPEVHRSNP